MGHFGEYGTGSVRETGRLNTVWGVRGITTTAEAELRVVEHHCTACDSYVRLHERRSRELFVCLLRLVFFAVSAFLHFWGVVIRTHKGGFGNTWVS